jgi:hypothetical protein
MGQIIATAEAKDSGRRASPEERYAREIIREHQEAIPEEPLRLAIYLSNDDEHSSVDVVEIIDGFGRNEISDEPALWEVTQDGLIGTEPALKSTREVRLFLTNPPEAVVAFRDHWAGTECIRDAVRSGRFVVIHGDPTDPLLDVIRGQ